MWRSEMICDAIRNPYVVTFASEGMEIPQVFDLPVSIGREFLCKLIFM